MFSESPFTPGLSEQIPRTNSSTLAPALEAAYAQAAEFARTLGYDLKRTTDRFALQRILTQSAGKPEQLAERLGQLLGKGYRAVVAASLPETAERLSPYRAGYTPAQRREIERRLVEGELLASVMSRLRGTEEDVQEAAGSALARGLDELRRADARG